MASAYVNIGATMFDRDSEEWFRHPITHRQAYRARRRVWSRFVAFLKGGK